MPPAELPDGTDDNEENPLTISTDGDFNVELVSVERQLAEILPASMLKPIKRIAYYIAKVGLPVHEACQIVGYELAQFKKMTVKYPLILRLVEMKSLEYKKDLLTTISTKARDSGDDKLALWLLERRFPEEFNPKKGGNPGEGEDLLGMAIEFIQRSGDGSPLVTERSGKAFVLKKGNATAADRKVVKDFLS